MSARGEPLAGLEAETARERMLVEVVTEDDEHGLDAYEGAVMGWNAARSHLAATLAEAREDVARALGSSRMALGTHADRWDDTAWQAAFWGETADAALSVIATRLGIEGEA